MKNENNIIKNMYDNIYSFLVKIFSLKIFFGYSFIKYLSKKYYK